MCPATRNRVATFYHSQVKVVHESLHASLIDNGFDPNRPLPGVCIHFSSPSAVEDNVQYNLDFSARRGTQPPTHVSIDKLTHTFESMCS